MFIFIWFVFCIIFAFVHFLLGNSGHALELFAIISALVLFLINKFKDRIKLTK
jgi:hypothetical protein|tara:strand:- start:4219 stop:4377 length:159 start_codon:yes stop_codon:yes gene_type:complete